MRPPRHRTTPDARPSSRRFPLTLLLLLLSPLPAPLILTLTSPAHAQDLAILTLDLPAHQPLVLAHPLLSIDSPRNAFPNRVADILFGLPDGSRLAKLDPNGQFQTNRLSRGFWSDPDMSLIPGEAAVVEVTAPAQIQFAGSLPYGILRTYLRQGTSLVAPPLPLEGRLFSDLGLPRLEGLSVSTLSPSGAWLPQGRITNGQWDGTEPEPSVLPGEGFLVHSPRSLFWEINHPPEPPLTPITFGPIPTHQNLATGQPLTLEAHPTNHATNLAFQWQHNGTNLPGATTPVLHLPQVTAQHQGDYWLMAYGPDQFQLSPMTRVTIGTPPLLLSVRRLPTAPHRIELSIDGVDGEQVLLERASSLDSWSSLGPPIALPAVLTIPTPDPAPTAFFYRARRP